MTDKIEKLDLEGARQFCPNITKEQMENLNQLKDVLEEEFGLDLAYDNKEEETQLKDLPSLHYVRNKRVHKIKIRIKENFDTYNSSK